MGGAKHTNHFPYYKGNNCPKYWKKNPTMCEKADIIIWGFNTIMKEWLNICKPVIKMTCFNGVYMVVSHLSTSIPQAEALI